MTLVLLVRYQHALASVEYLLDPAYDAPEVQALINVAIERKVAMVVRRADGGEQEIPTDDATLIVTLGEQAQLREYRRQHGGT